MGGCLKRSQMKSYQLLISSSFCSVGEKGIEWELHSIVDAYSGLWGPQMTWICQARYEAFLLKRRTVNRTMVNSPCLTICVLLFVPTRPGVGVGVRLNPRCLDLNLKKSTSLLALPSLLGPVIRLIIATVCWTPLCRRNLLCYLSNSHNNPMNNVIISIWQMRKMRLQWAE